MINMNETLNFSAQSIDTNGNVLMAMNASITDGNILYFSKNITDTGLYLGNKEKADSDYAEFESTVLKKIR